MEPTLSEALQTEGAIVPSKRSIINRQNALHSTGPRTLRGKNGAKYNARKHGLLAKETLAGIGNNRKARAEFLALLTDFRADICPVGRLEEMLVDEIVDFYWRLGLLRHFDRREAARTVKINGRELPLSDSRTSADLLQQIREDPDALAQRLDESLELIEQSIKRINTVGYLVSEEVERLRVVPGDLWQRCAASLPKPGVPYIFMDVDEPLRLSLQGESMLKELQKDLASLPGWKQVCLTVQRNPELRAVVSRPDIPGPEATERIIRYESHLHRLLTRSMDQLERLQRGRRGDFVPPPINAHLDVEP